MNLVKNLAFCSASVYRGFITICVLLVNSEGVATAIFKSLGAEIAHYQFSHPELSYLVKPNSKEAKE